MTRSEIADYLHEFAAEFTTTERSPDRNDKTSTIRE